MARQLQQLGHEIVNDPARAEWFVVNTCAVTQEATRKSRQLIRELNRANPEARTTVTGCYAHLAPDEMLLLPGVDRVVDNLGKDQLVAQVTGETPLSFDREPITRDAIPGALGRTRAFVKVQDGCDNVCTFCITTVARGVGRSRSMDEVIEEVRYLHGVGHQEVVLTGVHLGSYGHDFGDQDALRTLVRRILNETDVPRVRLSSLEPWDLSEGFFDLWNNPRLCKHLHLPLQSGCDATLKRMIRRTSQHEFRQLIQAARDAIPDVSITTDVIVGFPGETDDEFAISEAFIHEMNFSGLHVFRYSKRPGTAAARMNGHVDEAVKKMRSSRLLSLSQVQSRRFARRFVEQSLPVLWEQVTGATEAGFINVGYTEHYVRVRGVHPRPMTNMITQAEVQMYDEMVDQLVALPKITVKQSAI